MVRYVVEHVRRQHSIAGDIPERQRLGIGLEHGHPEALPLSLPPAFLHHPERAVQGDDVHTVWREPRVIGPGAAADVHQHVLRPRRDVRDHPGEELVVRPLAVEPVALLPDAQLVGVAIFVAQVVGFDEPVAHGEKLPRAATGTHSAA